MGKRMGGASPKKRERTVEQMTATRTVSPTSVMTEPQEIAGHGHVWHPIFNQAMQEEWPECINCGTVKAWTGNPERCPCPEAARLTVEQYLEQQARERENNDCPF